MRLLKRFAVVVLMLGIRTAAVGQPNDLDSFLNKLKQYTATHQPKTTWTMPVLKPAAGQATMPAPALVGYMEDQETGLRYYPKAGKVYDPETHYAYDLQTGKIFKGK